MSKNPYKLAAHLWIHQDQTAMMNFMFDACMDNDDCPVGPEDVEYVGKMTATYHDLDTKEEYIYSDLEREHIEITDSMDRLRRTTNQMRDVLEDQVSEDVDTSAGDLIIKGNIAKNEKALEKFQRQLDKIEAIMECPEDGECKQWWCINKILHDELKKRGHLTIESEGMYWWGLENPLNHEQISELAEFQDIVEELGHSL